MDVLAIRIEGTEVDPANLYDSEFYSSLSEQVTQSARICMPLFIELLNPNSILDVGCGQGNWLNVCRELGADDITGVDGAYVREEELKMAKDKFVPHDLMKPFNLERQFDLALCLEVGEHIPDEHAKTLVESLTKHSSAIIFSAAVPGQGGVNHINEQWPWYWKEKFAKHGYVQLDPFRRLLWGNSKVLIYYQTNIFLYVDEIIHRDLIDKVGVPDRRSELTLIRTTILQGLTAPGLIERAVSKAKSVFNRN